MQGDLWGVDFGMSVGVEMCDFTFWKTAYIFCYCWDLTFIFSSLVSICQTSDHLNAMRLPIIFLVPFPRFPLFLLLRIIHSHGPWWSERGQTGQNLPVTSTPLRIHTACDDFLRIRSTNASKTPLPLHYERRSVLVAKTSRNNCALSLFLPIQLSCCHIWTSYAG